WLRRPTEPRHYSVPPSEGSIPWAARRRFRRGQHLAQPVQQLLEAERLREDAPVPFGLERLLEKLGHVGLVLHHQYRHVATPMAPERPRESTVVPRAR